MANQLIENWNNGDTAFGIWCSIPSSLSAEIVARRGYDYVCLDYQHGMIRPTDGLPMLQAISATSAAPLVRVPWNRPEHIMNALDSGAHGYVVPLVNSAAEAEEAVRAGTFPGGGYRSFGPVRAKEVWGSSDPEVLNDVACIAMVETADGMNNLDEITAVKGLAGIYVGPNDLLLGLGLHPTRTPLDDPTYRAAIREIRAACDKNGIVPGIHASSAELAADYASEGYRMVTVGTDAAWLGLSSGRALATARGEDPDAIVGGIY